MNNAVLAALIAGLGTYFVTAIGAATVIIFKSSNTRVMNIMLGFSAGVMIAASFWSLLEPAIARAKIFLDTPPWLVATIGFMCGAAFMWLSDKAVTKAQKKLSSSSGIFNERINRIFLLVFSITIHNIPEGLAVGVAFGALKEANFSGEAVAGAVSIALGIALQNFPEGAAVSLPLRREGCSRLKSFIVGQSSAIVEPVFAIVGAMLVTRVQTVLPYALAFAAGAMILVAVHELIPECRKNSKESPYFATMGIVSGFAVMMLLDVALGG